MRFRMMALAGLFAAIAGAAFGEGETGFRSPLPITVADASATQRTEPAYDRAIGVCQLVAGSMAVNEAGDGQSMSPAIALKNYYRVQEHSSIAGQATVSVLQIPAHGKLLGDGEGSYAYVPEEGYLGSDRATLLVEVGSKKVRMEYFFRVMKSIPIENELVDPYRDNCPKKVRAWKISSVADSQGNTVLAARAGKVLTLRDGALVA